MTLHMTAAMLEWMKSHNRSLLIYLLISAFILMNGNFAKLPIIHYNISLVRKSIDWIWIYMINVLLSNSSIKIVCKIFLWYSCNGKYSESNTARVLWLYLLHNHCSQHLVMTMAKWIIIGVITSSSQPELDSSLALHLDCFQNLFALLLCTLLLHFVYLSRQLNMAIEPHLLTLGHDTINSGHSCCYTLEALTYWTHDLLYWFLARNGLAVCRGSDSPISFSENTLNSYSLPSSEQGVTWAQVS